MNSTTVWDEFLGKTEPLSQSKRPFGTFTKWTPCHFFGAMNWISNSIVEHYNLDRFSFYFISKQFHLFTVYFPFIFSEKSFISSVPRSQVATSIRTSRINTRSTDTCNNFAFASSPVRLELQFLTSFNEITTSISTSRINNQWTDTCDDLTSAS
jgi:hypothetical protein